MSTELLHNEQEILKKVSQGDEQAFRELFYHFAPKIKAYAISLTRSDYLAEELIQEVFYRIWLHRKRLSDITSVEAWLITVAKNTGSNILRRMAHEQVIVKQLNQQLVGVAELEQDLEWKQYHEKLYDAVEQLPPQQKKVWIMSRQLGIKQQQIAQDLQLSVYTVKEYLKKASIALRKSLKLFLEIIPSFFVVVCLLL